MKPVKKVFEYFLSVLALFSIELISVWVIFLGSFVVFLFIASKIFIHREEKFDYKIFDWMDSISSDSLTRLMKGITFFSNKEFVLILSLLLFVYFLFVKKHRWYSMKIPVVCIGCITFNLIIKSLFNRPRPLLPHLVEVTGLSFPSGHAMMSFSFYGLLIFLVWKSFSNKYLKYSLCTFFFILMHLIGFSRVYLRVHFASDVLAGFALGTIWLFLSIAVLRKIESFSAKRIPVDENLFN